MLLYICTRIMACLLRTRFVEPEKESLLGNGCVTRNNGVTVGSGVFYAVHADSVGRGNLCGFRAKVFYGSPYGCFIQRQTGQLTVGRNITLTLILTVWQTTDLSPRQRERPTSTSLQLSDNNKDLVLSPRWVLYSKMDWPTEPSVVT
jgi:hypothetical protein